VLCCGGLGVSLLFDALRDESAVPAAYGCGTGGTIGVGPDQPHVETLSNEQVHNAAIIIATGQKLKVPPRGWVIAVATALQESALRNLGDLGSRNDHDSLGLFQQRPSQGWGTAAEIMDPEYASTKFYNKLITIPNWLSLALTDAAQRVQLSAYPDAYAKHEPLAAELVNLLTGGAARSAGNAVSVRCAAAGELSAAGWTQPGQAAIVSGFRTADRPTHQGVDIGVPRGTIVRAASAGTVITVQCQAHTASGEPLSCDRDGSVTTLGCGWYVEILHAGNVMTRYCHLLQRPDVVVGEQVVAGQPIGLSGTSGHSSGPHLHFEVHVNGDSSPTGAVDPIRFMHNVGAPLGGQP
jgi:murein DD-endopeptidase MepM/ murein hydrolase activator NlpD